MPRAMFCIESRNALMTMNEELIKKSLELAGYNMLVTSELSMSDKDIYEAYHNLWRIEESFRIMKSQLDARPVYLQKENTLISPEVRHLLKSWQKKQGISSNVINKVKLNNEIMTTSSAGGFLCGYKPVVLAGSKEPLKIRHAHSYHRQALKGFSLCLVYWLTRKRVYVLFQ